MSLIAGTRLGPYEIVSPIGAGGMGEVWRGRDTRLDRSVAIKVLPADFAGNADFRARFDREARTISQLNHPNICTLYDIGHENGTDFLVMELLEGDTLSDRLEKGPLALADVLRYGAQIADALARAHRQGITHRDLKPANVILTKSGAKLLDFGLAKPLSAIRATSAPEDATQQKPLTQEGAVLGTFQYMAPEQLAGEEADARTDIFALGAVLYEMATGTRAFTGKNRTSLVANILGTNPRPISELQPMTPPSLERLIQHSLVKDPDERWQSAADIADELRWIGDTASQSGGATSPVRPRRNTWLQRSLVPALALIAIAALAILARDRLKPQRPFIVPIAPPTGLHFNAIGNTSGPAVISPDGRLLVFSAARIESVGTLWIYSTETGEAKQLESTSGATFPFWSPDSKSVGFFAESKLKRIDIDGGGAATVSDAPNARGGTWGAGDVILFTPSTTSPIHGVPASGGPSVPVTKLDATVHTTHRWPEFMPDGKHFVYVATSHRTTAGPTTGLYLGSLDGKVKRRLINLATSGVYASGHLFYVRDNILFEQKLSRNFVPEGEPRIITRGAVFDIAVWRSVISAASDGTLLFHTGSGAPRSELTLVDRSGNRQSTLGPPDVYRDCRLSPDGRKLLIGVGDPGTQIWLHDLERDVRRRFTSDVEWSGSPVWSRDGSTVYYLALQQGIWSIVSAAAAGGKSARVILRVGDAATRLTDVSPDDKWIVCDLNSNAMMVPASGGEPRRLFPVSPTRSAVFSPDGKWIAYVSSESGGRAEVFIASAEERSTKWQVSTSGGAHPGWRADGKELFYLTSSGQTLSSVTIDASPGNLQISSPRELFSASFKIGFLDRPYSVTPDGQRIWGNLAKSDDVSGLTMVKNWRSISSAGER